MFTLRSVSLLAAGLATAWKTIIQAYGALFAGALGDPARIIAALQSGNALEIRRAVNPILESLVNATPYIFAGLAVALGFRSGLFNIGVEGQLFMGAAAATFVGFAVKGLPAIIHMPLAFLAGAVGGGLWGFIPGWLKAKTGGHEVINTIMMNWIAFRLTEWLLSRTDESTGIWRHADQPDDRKIGGNSTVLPCAHSHSPWLLHRAGHRLPGVLALV